MSTTPVRDLVAAEYDRCISMANDDDKLRAAPSLYGIDHLGDKRAYYTYRAEALGWVLDKMKQGGHYV